MKLVEISKPALLLSFLLGIHQCQAQSSPAQSAASLTANPFPIRAGEGDFVLRIGADFQIDNRTFPGVSLVPLTDQILIRRARPTFSGAVYKYIRPDFGQGQVILYEACAQLNYFSRFTLRVSKFKRPVGLEHLQSDDDTNHLVAARS